METQRTINNINMPDFSNSKNKFKINNPYGEGNHDTSSKHGTNANYKKAGAPGFFGNLAKGKGLLGGLLNPMGAIASKIGGKAEKVLNPASMLGGGGTGGVNQAVGGTPPAADPNAAPVDPVNTNAIDPTMSGAPMYGKKKGAPMYGKKKGAPKHKKGAPKLKGNQHKIDKNKDGKISKADFNMMNK